MRKVEYTVYQFNELSDFAKQKAIESMSQFLYESIECDELIDNVFKPYLDDRGLPSDKIRFSLSYSQGDGVAFYGPVFLSDLFKFNQDIPIDLSWQLLFNLPEGALDDIYICISGDSSRHHHWNSMRVNIDDRYVEEWCRSDRERNASEEVIDLLDCWLSDYIQKCSRDLERMGYEYIENMTSDEARIECIEANGYEFDEHGNIV